MKSNHLGETPSNSTQKDELARKFIKTIEKISGTKMLDTQSCYDFTLKIPHDDYISGDIVTNVEITEEQLQRLREEIKPLTRG